MKISKAELPMISPPAHDGADTRNPKLLQAARMYEKQFLREMVQAMRRTVENGGLIETGMGEQVFRDKLDEEYVETWGDKGGIGLADMIYTQVAERYGLDASSRLKMQKGVAGPMPLSNYQVHKIEHRKQAGDLNMKVQLKDPNESAQAYVQTPFGGQVVAKGPLSEGRTLVRVAHEDLLSEFKFRGKAEFLNLGERLPSAARIGLLSDPELKFDWTLSGRKTPL